MLPSANHSETEGDLTPHTRAISDFEPKNSSAWAGLIDASLGMPNVEVNRHPYGDCPQSYGMDRFKTVGQRLRYYRELPAPLISRKRLGLPIDKRTRYA